VVAGIRVATKSVLNIARAVNFYNRTLGVRPAREEGAHTAPEHVLLTHSLQKQEEGRGIGGRFVNDPERIIQSSYLFAGV
jgi:hypothetical protein